MGYPKEVYDRAWEELERRKQVARERQTARREEIRREIPEIDRIERELAGTASAVTQAVIAGKGDTAARVAKLGEMNLALQKQRRELLQQRGYAPDYLDAQYGCDKCRDTGYAGSRMCECLRDFLAKAAYAQLSAISGAGNCRFDNFSLHYYPDQPVDASGVVPRQRMQQIYDYCKQYGETFSENSESVLMLGRTGLGKTHLSLAIGAAVTQAGYGVVYTPVQKLMDRLEAEKFSRNGEVKEHYAGSMESVLQCNLLVLDDLGTEFLTQFTGSVLYNLINSRMVEGRPTIISTNLELNEIEEKYSQRMVSRLVCSYKVLKFYGKDIRFIKKSEYN